MSDSLQWQSLPAFSMVTEAEWGDWKWQLRQRLRTPQQVLEAVPGLAGYFAELGGEEAARHYPLLLTPFSAASMAHCLGAGDLPWLKGYLRTLLPDSRELTTTRYALIDGDPVGEQPTAGGHAMLSRFYPDRILVHTGFECPVHCRYCFRRDRIFPDLEKEVPVQWRGLSEDDWVRVLRFIRESPPRENNAGTDPKIRDVIFSGGDPLVFGDSRIARMLAQLREIPHVRLIRFDTKMITTNPYRITPAFVEMLKSYHPIYFNLHFTHPYELDAEVRAACEHLADAGIVLGAHTPLLGGVNDDELILERLFLGLLEVRVRPYYLIHHIPTPNTAHFSVSPERGRALMKGLWGRVSGLANPTYIVYLPSAKGKVPYMPQFLLERGPDGYWFETFEGDVGLFPISAQDT